jgi:ATP-dependent DNA helicase RecQ
VSKEQEVVTLEESLKEYFGFDQFKGNQKEIIESILAKKDTFVSMPTGGGKSLCYQLPALASKGTAIVISPLIALMKNQVDLVRSYSSVENIAHFLNSSLNKGQIKQVKDDITEGKTKILYVAPESLVKEENIDFLKTIKISFVAVDEAHCISEWGHDFRPEYRKIRRMIEDIEENVPIMALTATATPKVRLDIVKTLSMQEPNLFLASFLRPNLYYEVRPKVTRDSTIKDIIKFLKKDAGKSGIIYCLSRKTTEELAEILQLNGFRAGAYHAGLDGKTRDERQDQFLMEDLDIIVATIAFGMGIDKPDVRFVIHFDIPKSLENYYQETGRGGRDGLEGHCIAYYSPKDLQKLEKFMKDKPVAEREIGGQHLMEMEAFVETGECRKKFVLHYFGEDLPQNCGMCDNCKHPKPKVEAKDDVALVLKCVEETNEQQIISHLVNIILGKNTKDIASYGHDKISSFGKGASKDLLYWNSVVRKTILLDLLRKEIELYGVLKITETGQDFLKNPYSVEVMLNHVFEDGEDNDEEIISGNSKGNAADPILCQMLLDLRKSVGAQKKLPPYVIFQETSIEDMATQYPITMDELSKIAGVSIGKAQKFGKPFVELIAKYVEENDIDRPSDFTDIKSLANKSIYKIKIIGGIDKRLPLDDISKSLNMTMSELVAELESIVFSGTKVNIDYYLDEKIDEEVQEIIHDYFMESTTDDLQEAYKVLKEEDIQLNEIQLMRIKFMSEVAN